MNPHGSRKKGIKGNNLGWYIIVSYPSEYLPYAFSLRFTNILYARILASISRYYTGSLRCTVWTSGIIPPVNNGASTLYSIYSEACTCSALSKSCEEKQRRAERRCAAAGLTATSGGIRYVYSASRHAPLPILDVLSCVLSCRPLFVRFLAISRFPSSRYQLSRRPDFPMRVF